MSNHNIASRLFLKAMEECGESVQAIAKLLDYGPEGKWDDGTTNIDKACLELADVAVFTALLLESELIDSEVFWAGYHKKLAKWHDKMKKAMEEENKTEANDNNTK